MVNDLVVNVNITNVMGIDGGWLQTLNMGLYPLDDGEPIQAVESIVGQAFHDQLSSPENPVSIGRRNFELRKHFGLRSRPSAAGTPLRHDYDVHRVTSLSMTCNCATAAEHLVIWVGYDYQYF